MSGPSPSSSPSSPADSASRPRAGGAQRLLVLAHGMTADLHQARFGGTAGLSRPVPPTVDPAVTEWVCGPEPACRETLGLLAVGATVIDALAGPRFGSWSDRTLAEVAAEDPQTVAGWARDVGVEPPGGESLATLVRRVRGWVDGLQPPGWSGVVVTPLVARALVAAAVDAGPDVALGIDIAPGGRAVLTRSGSRWRLQQLG